jgi:hypothetical protein
VVKRESVVATGFGCAPQNGAADAADEVPRAVMARKERSAHEFEARLMVSVRHEITHVVIGALAPCAINPGLYGIGERVERNGKCFHNAALDGAASTVFKRRKCVESLGFCGTGSVEGWCEGWRMMGVVGVGTC